MPNSLKSPAAGYGVALLAVVLAVAVRVALDPILGDSFPFATLFLAVLVAAWFGGFGPALFATVLGAPLAARFLLPPRDSFAVEGLENRAGLLVYLLTGTGMAALGGLMHRSRERATAAAAAQLHLAAIVEGSEDAIVGKDLDGTITTWNEAAERLYGYPAAEVVGKPFSVLVPPDRAAEVADLAPRLRRGERVEHFETVRRRKDGTLVPVSVSYSPVRDAGGRLIGTAAITRDVTEQKQALAALKASEARFAAVIHNAPAIVFLKDPAGVYLMANRRCAENVGLSLEQVLGRTDHDLFPPAVADAFRRDDQEVLRTGQIRTFEETFELPGRRLTYLTSKFPLPGEVGVCGIATDISDRQAAEERLRDEVRISETLNRLGPKVAAELDLEKVVQLVTDEATRLTEAQFGAFFYNVRDERGESYMLNSLSGAPRDAFAQFPMSRITAVFEPTFRGQGAVRLDDVTQDPRYGQNGPHRGMPEGHLPVRSYLAVPVVSRSGEVLGGLFFGHVEVGVFTERHERLVVGMAAQAAIAIDNARLYGRVQEQEERFRQLAEHITDVFWLVEARTRQLLYISPAYEEVWGRSRQSLYESPSSYLDGVHPDDRDRVRALSDRLAGGEPGSEEYRVFRPDGSVRWVTDRGYPIRGADGSVTRVAGIVEDVTARKRAETSTRFLADASSVLAALTDEASALQKVAGLAVPHFADWCAVDMADADGSLRRLAVVHVDPEKVRLAHHIHGRWPPDPDAPHGVSEILRTGRPQLVPEIIDGKLASAIPDPELLRLLRKLGLRSYIGVPLTVRGKVIGAITFIAAESGRRYDAADLAAAEDLARRSSVAIENAQLYQAVREAGQRKDEFLATLAHELRNPLAPIRNALYLLRTTGATGPTVPRALDMMSRQTDVLARLVDELLDVSRVMRGKVDLRPEPLDLAAIASRAVETAQPLIDSRRHTLTVEVPDQPVRVTADPMRMTEVVSNLVTNAAKYTEPGGKIRLAVEEAADRAVIRVTDTGVGIATDALAKVFDLFFQADTTAAGTQGGLGIGLTLVKRLVELHGGTVEAHSGGLGKGSEFVVQLPLLRRDEGRGMRDETTSYSPSSLIPHPSSFKKRVLVVDDNYDAADSLAMLLRLEGHDVRVARNGPSAVEAAQSDPPDVVLLDLGMPGMDGFEVARRLRQGPAARTFIAALTGWGQEEDRRRTREAGFDHHLVKPADPNDLRELLARVGPD